jgi:hypothetical protein
MTSACSLVRVSIKLDFPVLQWVSRITETPTQADPIKNHQAMALSSSTTDPLFSMAGEPDADKTVLSIKAFEKLVMYCGMCWLMNTKDTVGIASEFAREL